MEIIKAFNSNDLHTNIVIKGTYNEPLFRASDIGEILEISNIRQNIQNYDKTEKDVVCLTDSAGRNQNITFLTEKGLYKVLFKSRKPIAEKFQNWVCEVIKEIRINGIYVLENQLKEKEEQIQQKEEQIQQKEEQIQQKEEQIKENYINTQKEKDILQEKTILNQFPSNVQCIYYGLIDNKNNENEQLIKFGNSNFLCDRVEIHKKTYINFRLINAFKVDNKIQIENTIKKHPILSKIRCELKINNINHNEILSINSNLTLDKLEQIIKEIIVNIEYNPENYKKILNENEKLNMNYVLLKEELEKIKNKTSKDNYDSLKATNFLLIEENEKLKLENIRLIKKYKINTNTNNFIIDDEININDVENYNTIIKTNLKKIIKSADGLYYINGNIYKENIGTREKVWEKIAYKTSGGLIKEDLLMNKHGIIVSKKKFIDEKKNNRFQKINKEKQEKSKNKNILNN
jgi:prophage antirepressor-like protein